MTLHQAYTYLIDNYRLYLDSLNNDVHALPIFGMTLFAIFLFFFGIAVSMYHDTPSGIGIMVISVVAFFLLLTGDYDQKSEAKDFDTEYYQKTLADFQTNLIAEMTKEQTDLPKKELKYDKYNAITRYNTWDNPIFDVAITFGEDTVIKRVRVISTNNANLIGLYRELPDNIKLDKEPFTKYEGFLFVKDIESLGEPKETEEQIEQEETTK